MAQKDDFTKSVILNNLRDNLVKMDSQSEGDKTTLFSLSANIHRCSDLADNSDGLPWVSSFDSLNQWSSDLEKNSFRREDLSMANETIYEEKDDDLERDVSMNSSVYTASITSTPILRKRTSFYKTQEYEMSERISNQGNEWCYLKEEDDFDMRHSELVYSPKRMSKLRKLRSEVLKEANTNEIFNGYQNERHHSRVDLPLWDKTDMFNRMNTRVSPRKSMKDIARSMREEMKYEARPIKNFDDSPFGPWVFEEKENNHILQFRPIMDAEMVDPKLYKEISMETDYIPQIELNDICDRKHSSINSISCHTVSICT
jgi:hypothetical protein